MTDREDYIKELHREKLAAHSRENEGCDLCDDCDETYPECGKDPDECQREADEESRENDYEARREMFD